MSDEPAARKARTMSMFDRIAPYYDAGEPGCFAHFGRQLVDVLGVAAGHHVLDVATGRGAALFPAAEYAGATGTVTGIDLAEGMVRAVSDEAALRGVRAQLHVMDAEQLDFPDATFDRVLCGFGIMFFPQLDQALTEFHRVLKPGGQLGVSTWRVTPVDDLGEVLLQLGIRPNRGDAPRFGEPADVVEALTAAHFVEVRAQLDSATFRYHDLDAYWQQARSTVLRQWLDALDAAHIKRVTTALTERVQQQRRADGFYLSATAVLAVASRPE